MIGQNVSHYCILDKLGGGGMGVVYSARDTILDRNVAMKFLPADSLKDKLALELLRKSVLVGYANADWPRQDPDLKILHDDLEFLKLFPGPKSK